MHRGTPILTLACKLFSTACMKNYRSKDRGEDMQFHDKKNEKKYEELLLNSILYSNYLTRN